MAFLILPIHYFSEEKMSTINIISRKFPHSHTKPHMVPSVSVGSLLKQPFSRLLSAHKGQKVKQRSRRNVFILSGSERETHIECSAPLNVFIASMALHQTRSLMKEGFASHNLLSKVLC